MTLVELIPCQRPVVITRWGVEELLLVAVERYGLDGVCRLKAVRDVEESGRMVLRGVGRPRQNVVLDAVTTALLTLQRQEDAVAVGASDAPAGNAEERLELPRTLVFQRLPLVLLGNHEEVTILGVLDIPFSIRKLGIIVTPVHVGSIVLRTGKGLPVEFAFTVVLVVLSTTEAHGIVLTVYAGNSQVDPLGH